MHSHSLQPDRMQIWGRTTVQFGPLNNRVYLMHVHPGDCPKVLNRAEETAHGLNLSKIVAKVPRDLAAEFLMRGYVTEACIPGLFSGCTDGLYVSRFLTADRGRADNVQCIQAGIALEGKRGGSDCSSDPRGLGISLLGPERAVDMAHVYRKVFQSYPFPLFDSGYIQEVMRSHVRFYGLLASGEIAAVASCEMDSEHGCVEMTDFATLPEYRGQGLAGHLLQRMHRDMGEHGLQTAFTIARAEVPAMNAVFAAAGYAWAGTLINNTHMDGKLESMHVWWARLGSGE